VLLCGSNTGVHKCSLALGASPAGSRRREGLRGDLQAGWAIPLPALRG